MKKITTKQKFYRLKQRHKTWAAVAKKMGISYRQLVNVRNGSSKSGSTMRLLDILVDDLKNK